MEVLITGAGGRIGSHLARILHTEGHSVRAFGLSGDHRLRIVAEELGLAVFEGDLLRSETLVEAVGGVDVVCHLAAALTTHDASDGEFATTNLTGTFNLLEAVRDHAGEISRFVYTSSDAVYWGGLDGPTPSLPVDETHPLLAGTVYGATKVGAEALCRAFASSYGIPCTVIRPTATAAPAELVDRAGPFGRRWFLESAIARLEARQAALPPADRDLLRRLREAHAGTDGLFYLTGADGTASLNMLTDVRDTARAMRAMIDTPEAVGQAFNIGPDAPHSDRQFLEELASKLGMRTLQIPYERARPSWYVSSVKAKAVLGYQPRYSVFDMIAEATEAT